MGLPLHTWTIEGNDPWNQQLVRPVHWLICSKLFSNAILVADDKRSNLVLLEFVYLLDDVGVCKKLIYPLRIDLCVCSKHPLHVGLMRL